MPQIPHISSLVGRFVRTRTHAVDHGVSFSLSVVRRGAVLSTIEHAGLGTRGPSEGWALAASGKRGTTMLTVDARVEEFILNSFLFGDAERMPSRTESLLQTGVIDSTGVLELIEFLEAEFQLRVDETESVPENLDSIENLVRFVAVKTA
jgi:acyl carrier protein